MAQRDELYRKTQIAIGWTEEYRQYMDSLMSIDTTHIQLRGKSVSDMRTMSTLGVNGQGPKLGPMKKRTDFHTSGEHIFRSEAASGESQFVYPRDICDSDTEQLKKRQCWNCNGNDGDGPTGLNLVPSS